ncbi:MULTISPECIES: cellulase family glycosylhydrolase [unclassified Fibrobacter]|uniref:cellulase family glycosylhydrolase n=1 Tax=unclassified Fibrobacter TaxID=2634177 RepID=UPI000D6D7EF5|nr:MULTISPECIES: cellulase family glycosylhydrolase [unclassified Fibrobacter]PWJ68996.1 endoglucanase [Fibrobacter sp. UWR4]PZW70842.1 endoglucanase [Fibrobacter sp. UWR1]
MTFFSKSMKALVLGGSLLMGTTLANASAATAKPLRVGPVSNYGTLGTSGNKIVSLSNKKEVMLRGMSMFWSDATGLQYYNKNVMKWAAENLKVDVIRYAMGIQYYDSQGGTSGEMDVNYSYKGNPDKQKGIIDQMVEAAIENDIYLIIDWHSHRADKEQALAADFFSEMAKKYANVPNIIWEVFNEPVNQSMGTIASYANSVISGIRAAGSKNLALVGTPRWSQMGECGGVSGDNVGYVFHFYAATHTKNSYSGNIDKCRSQGNAVFITEWGTTTADGKGGASEGNTNDWTSYMETNKISNCNWSLRNEVSTIGEKSTEGSALFSGEEFLNTTSKLNGATYSNSGKIVSKYLTSHASSWADSLMAGAAGACGFKAEVTASAGTLANVFKSGCTYTSSDPTVVANDGTILKPGLAILTGSDGSKSVATIKEEPNQTFSGFSDVTCFIGGSCTKSKALKDMDGDGKLEVIIVGSTKTVEGAQVTLRSLNPEILTIKEAMCTSQFCYAAKNTKAPMYEFTGTLGEAKVVATAPAIAGYNAYSDTVTITYKKGDDKLPGNVFKNTTVAKGAMVADFFPATTYYSKQPVTYTFDGKPTSTYLSNVNNALVAGNQDAIVTIKATSAGNDEREPLDLTITVVVGDSLAAINSGNVSIRSQKMNAGALKAQFSKGGISLEAMNSGLATVEIFNAKGKALRSIETNINAGANWIPVSGLRAGHYIVRLSQEANVQLYTLEKK